MMGSGHGEKDGIAAMDSGSEQPLAGDIDDLEEFLDWSEYSGVSR